MGYIDSSYYRSTFKGADTDDNTLAALVDRASDTVDYITGYAIQRVGGLTSFPADTIALVEKATAYQTEYFVQNGGLETANSGQGVAADSVAIGKTNIKQRMSGKQQNSDPRICPMTISILEQTGLMNRQVQTLGGEFMGWGGWPIW